MHTILVTGASSGIGALTCRALADAGHTVWAGMRATAGRNAAAAQDAAAHPGGRIRPLELDVTDAASVRAAALRVLTETPDLDVVVHNAGHMALGPAEAFSVEEVGHLFDVNVLGTQRLNRELLPHLRARGEALLLWVGSSSTRGGTPPFLGPYFAAKAAMDALAVSYAAELIRFGVDTCIVVPGPFTSGTQHFPNAGRAADVQRAAAYDDLYGRLQEEVPARLATLEPSWADVATVAAAIAEVVDRPAGDRPFRVHVDPTDDGSEVVSAVADRMRVEMFRRLGLTDLLPGHPAPAARAH
ncbi:MAG: Dehydrogenases with different specificities (related to short-chain alcohol dehydrogenases) [uncultured Quadrisphaera sp.]|uniref:Dehydrogenases with different specificities (Related to short-chain alcohol dehydrogenases) n=1 Tax=uncultured Quadrisphaera sp. TaxID=904978 RepID=A0A6J4Q8F9_9ACTN|nr:MAG: Dehydrogenases with different specificities (related to short-chain alcohol dehydrogenases) [uncultured Quadrisphaera sp.]